jgi:hypothetical protein
MSRFAIPASERESGPATISVVTDISANIFAVFMLILIAALAASPAQAPTPVARDAIDDLGGIERAPLSAAAMVDLLHARTQVAEGPPIRIDLFEDRLVIARKGVPDLQVSTPEAALDALAETSIRSASIPVYVFSARHFAAIRSALGSNVIRDLPVPAALQTMDAAGRRAWSPGFADLIFDNLDRPAFTSALARLLDGSTDKGAGGTRRADPGFAADPQAKADLLTRLALWSRTAALWAAVITVLLLVAVVERRRR